MFNKVFKDVYSKLFVVWVVGFFAIGFGYRLALDLQNFMHIHQGLSLVCQWAPDRPPHVPARPEFDDWLQFHWYVFMGLLFVAWALWETRFVQVIYKRVSKWVNSLDEKKAELTPAAKTEGGSPTP